MAKARRTQEEMTAANTSSYNDRKQKFYARAVELTGAHQNGYAAFHADEDEDDVNQVVGLSDSEASEDDDSTIGEDHGHHDWKAKRHGDRRAMKRDREQDRNALTRILESHDMPPETGLLVLRECIAKISALNRKKHPTKEQLGYIEVYVFVLGHMYAGDEFPSSDAVPYAVFLGLLLSSHNTYQQGLCLEALVVTLLNCPAPELLPAFNRVLKRVVQSEHGAEHVKSGALHLLGLVFALSHPPLEDVIEALGFFHDIIESDGGTVGEIDNVLVVGAAIRAWVLTAGSHDDIEDQAREALDLFIDQLESTEVPIQAAAAEAIAFVVEYSRQLANEEGGKPFNIRHKPEQLISLMKGTWSTSVKVTGKKLGRSLKKRVNSAITSIERARGPNYAVAGRPVQNPHLGGAKVDDDFLDGFVEFGYQDVVESDVAEYPINTWTRWAIRTALNELHVPDSAIATHLDNNPHLVEIMLASEPLDEE